MTDLRIETSDGVSLEASLSEAAGAAGTIVLCHPHPQHGGTMRHPLLEAIASHASASGLDALRFNFRGIGSSGGTWDRGDGERADVAAAVAWTEIHRPPVAGIAGWSFGAAMALVWQAETGSTIPYVGIAPPTDSVLTPKLPVLDQLAPAERLFIVGNRDQFVDADELEEYATGIDASIIRYETADHFFIFRHDRLAADVVSFLSSGAGPLSPAS